MCLACWYSIVILLFTCVHSWFINTGGGTLTISGYGFKDGATVAVGAGECEVLSVDPDEILCVIPSSVSYTYLSTCKMSYIAGILFKPLPCPSCIVSRAYVASPSGPLPSLFKLCPLGQ